MHEYRSPPFNPRESEGLGAISENVAISPGRFFRLHNFSSCLISHPIPPFPSRFASLHPLPLPLPPFRSQFLRERTALPLRSPRYAPPFLSFQFLFPPSTCCSLLFLFSSRDFFRSNILSKKEGVEAVGKHGMDSGGTSKGRVRYSFGKG